MVVGGLYILVYSGPIEIKRFTVWGRDVDELIELGFEEQLPRIQEIQLNDPVQRRRKIVADPSLMDKYQEYGDN